jgi:hypothetical protein
MRWPSWEATIAVTVPPVVAAPAIARVPRSMATTRAPAAT